jgi:hypothetical protein
MEEYLADLRLAGDKTSCPVAQSIWLFVTKVLEPIWTIKPETPSRVRGRIGIVTPGVGRVCRCRGLERTDSCFCVIVGARGGRRRNW